MANPLDPTVPQRPHADQAGHAGHAGHVAGHVAGHDDERAGVVEKALAAAADDGDPIARAVARARAEAGLFGDATAHRIGRYRVIERAGAGGMGVVWSAWDPELGRGVALKLASSGDARARAQVLDEGRALARLSHPNVVPIYDVLEAPEGVFLIMELVKGRTLRELAATATVAELVRAYRQAGDGLAAAHEAGLIHRDFKSDNAIIGADERVRVLDFGLAHGTEQLDVPTIAGTPRYMAPEQRDGLALTPAVDQFGLAVALEEALPRPIPKWLIPVLARGRAEGAAQRYPSMAELVHALALTPAVRWRQRALIGGATLAAVAIIAAFAIGRTRREEAPCEAGVALIAPSWGGGVRARAATHLAGLSGAYAAEARARILDGLDQYSASWVQIQRGACLQHRSGTISAAMLDRRDACLARRLGSVATIGKLAIRAEAADIAGLIVAVGSLPEPGACGDDDALLSPVAPPPSERAARVAAVADRIARVDIERDAGHTTEASREVEGAIAEARELGYAPVLARALVARGRIALSLSGEQRGANDFLEATQLALVIGDDPLAIEAYARAAYAIATTAARPGRPGATEGLALIESITARAGNRASFERALLHNNIGAVALAHGDRAAARSSFERARGEAAGLTGGAAIELTTVLLGLMLVVDDPVARDEIGADLVATRVAMLGPNHPLTLEAEITRATLRGDPRGLSRPCLAMATLHPEERASIRECAYEITWRALVARDLPTAAAMAARVIAAEDPTGGDSRVLRARAFLLLAQGDRAAALVALTAIPELADTAAWWRRLTEIDVAIGIAIAHEEDAAAWPRDLDRAEHVCRDLAELAPVEVASRRAAITMLRARHAARAR